MRKTRLSFSAALTFPAQAWSVEPTGIDARIDSMVAPVVEKLGAILFWNPFGPAGLNLGLEAENVSFILLWLLFGAIFFTVSLGFINFRRFGHAVALTMGRYRAAGSGQLTHFQALCTALSGTVGLGNIAGVAVAISAGGPGATLWMMLIGLLGMSSKYAECLLGVQYRKVDANGKVYGGPMHYLSEGLARRNLAPLGKMLAALFALMCIGGSLGGGNMFQANQVFQLSVRQFESLEGHGAMLGLGLAFVVGLVIIGGITRIADVTKRVVPFMFLVYACGALYVIGINIDKLGLAFGMIINGAFDPGAMKGGVLGVLLIGAQRAAFSNEAGIGSASIAHSAVRTKDSVTEGSVAMLEPFVDTVCICTLTALVLIFSGYATDMQGLEGAALTSAAFASVVPWFDKILLVVVWMFAFSTMLAWSYYGLQSWNYLFGRHAGKPIVELSYNMMFLIFIVIGAASAFGSVLEFADMMIISMAFPNILGLLLLNGEVRALTRDYYRRLKEGRIDRASN